MKQLSQRNKKFFFKCFVLLGFILFEGNAGAYMTLNKIIIYFNADDKYQNILVSNPGTDPLYLKINVDKIQYPGTLREKRVHILDPDKINLLISTTKIKLMPNQSAWVRLVSLSVPKKQEMVYRVNFVPVDNSRFTPSVNKKQKEHTQLGIKLLVSYQVLVFVRPQKSYIQLSTQIDKRSITFMNYGNINVLLRDGKYCQNENAKKCVPLNKGKRLYAGNHWKVFWPQSAKKTGVIRWGLFDGQREHNVIFSLSKTESSKVIEVY